MSKEQSDIEPIVQSAKMYFSVLEGIADNRALLEDKELGELAKEELKELESKKAELENEIKLLLIPKDPNDSKNIYLEIRAGTGGDESLWAIYLRRIVAMRIYKSGKLRLSAQVKIMWVATRKLSRL